MRTLTFSLLLACAAFAQTPAINSGGVVNTAGATSVQAVAPGALVSIFGSNLSATMALSDSVPLSSKVGGVSVTIAGLPAPIQFVSPNQINVEVPWGTPVSDSSGPAQLIVTSDSLGSASTTVTVVASAPSLYSIGSQGLAVNSDGTLAAAAGAVPGITTRPAKIGDAGGLILFATGMGAVDNPLADGANSADLTRNTLAQPTVTVGGVAAQVTFSGLSPQFVGVNQINIVLAAGTPTGSAVPVQLQVNGSTVSNLVTIAVSQ
jgi:uncharacterized protein (TIGR03437 family)